MSGVTGSLVAGIDFLQAAPVIAHQLIGAVLLVNGVGGRIVGRE